MFNDQEALDLAELQVKLTELYTRGFLKMWDRLVSYRRWPSGNLEASVLDLLQCYSRELDTLVAEHRKKYPSGSGGS